MQQTEKTQEQSRAQKTKRVQGAASLQETGKAKAFKKSNKPRELLLYLLILTVSFLMFQCSFFIQGSGLYLGDFKLVANHLHIPLMVLPGILFYISMQLVIHLAYAMFIYAVTRCVMIAIPPLHKNPCILGIKIWFCGLITILLANQFYFPNSKFASMTATLIHPSFLKYTLWFFFILSFLILLTAAAGFCLLLLRKIKVTLALFTVGLLTTAGFESHHLSPIVDAGTVEKPNVIIIGVDSLRPDFLGYFGGAKRTPHLDALLEQSTVFSEAMTPLARTFPAWVSILTGEYPKKDDARFNLQPTIHFDLTQTLPAILQRQGYETIFSTDDTRFSNIDQTFGFDRVITPPMGFNDFLVGTLNDFPLSNLLVNSPLGYYLFPYSYANRPVYTTYDPNTFLRLLKDHLQGPRQKPLFLVTHFCLPHYPYFWGRQPAYVQYLYNYQAAVHRVDQQINDYLTILKNDKLLEHSIVILLSDHGEAIELRGDRATDADFFIPGQSNSQKVIPQFYPPALSKEAVNQSAGHGTDVLSIPQYHTVLAFRFFGIPGHAPSLVTGRVSLLDIKPTLLTLLHIPFSPLAGKSLVDYLTGTRTMVPSQDDFFTESDFSPQAVRTVHPETRQVLFEGIRFFEINPQTGRLGVKKSMADLIISSKQFADFNGPWVLALYPQTQKTMMPILLNLDTGFWTNDLTTSWAKHSPASQMLKALKTFYGNDLTTIAIPPKGT